MAPKTDAGRMVMLVIMVTAALAVAAGLLVYLNRGPEYAISAEVAARLPPKIQPVARRLVGEPCNRTLEVELVSSLLEHAEYGAIVAFSEQTTGKCGANEELLAAVVTAQLRSSDFVAAERTADHLVVAYPADPAVFGWRAEAREKRSNFAGAYADMRTALSLFLDPSDVALSVYYDQARLAAKAGHPCEAVVTLRDYIAFDPEKRRTQQLTTLMRGWQNDGSCEPLSGTGSARLRFDPNATAIIVPVEVNGVPARMVVDTGASRTALSKQLASRAGIEPSAPQGAIVTTAMGKTWLPGGRADHISLGGARLSDVPVFIQNSADRSFGDGVDGLLGLSFLGNFHVRIGGGVLELRPTE
jgi:clan AA aspartic protease (TIGR02281 family)